jgi:outer membrane protein OmpA-like peptidoglycan-associated protein
MKTRKQYLFLSSALILCTNLHAAEQNFGNQAPTKQQIIQALRPDVSEQIETAAIGQHPYEGDVIKGQERNISFNLHKTAPKAKSPTVFHDPKVKKQVENAISMQVQFDYKSAELTKQAKAHLKSLGEALASNQLKSVGFVVEGHTDAIGSEGYNKDLSEQRADSVKRFLMGQYGVNSKRLHAIGRGESHLLDAKNPDSDVNRRVRIVATN